MTQCSHRVKYVLVHIRVCLLSSRRSPNKVLEALSACGEMTGMDRFAPIVHGMRVAAGLGSSAGSAPSPAQGTARSQANGMASGTTTPRGHPQQAPMVALGVSVAASAHTRPQLLLGCMQFVNALLTAFDDLDQRLHLRNEFLRAGMIDLLEVRLV